MTVIASETYTSTNAPIQYAAVKAFSDNEEIDKYLKDTRVILKSLCGYIYRKYKRVKISVAKPDGGFYFFLDFSNFSESLKSRGISDSVDLCDRILYETGAAILPGISFGRPKDEFTARMAYVNFDGDKALKYLVNNKIEHELKDEELREIAPDLLEGVDILCEWVGNL
jgi:aspartate aminotransferase